MGGLQIPQRKSTSILTAKAMRFLRWSAYLAYHFGYSKSAIKAQLP